MIDSCKNKLTLNSLTKVKPWNTSYYQWIDVGMDYNRD